MSHIPFSESELALAGEKSGPYPSSPSSPKLSTPITMKENFTRALRREKPLWMPFVSDKQGFSPRIFPDNVVCGLVADGERELTLADFSGKGWFDTEWKYVEQVRGATTVPGKEQLTDVNEWRSVLKFPSLGDCDWEGSARANAGYLDRERIVCVNMLCGYWERLMALMDVSEGAIAMIDEDCKESVHGLFDALTDLYIDAVDRCCEHYAPQMILLHDDWGTQRAPFFTVETIDEMIIPHLKRFVGHIHGKGLFFELHSCGQNEPNVPLMIKAGVDLWNGQPMNDKYKIAKQYSKDIMIGVDMPAIAPETPDEEAARAAVEFFEKYKDLRVYVGDRTPNLAFTRTLYRLSREYYK